MYLLLTDETNREPTSDAKFFMYGGLFFPIEQILDIDKEIKRIRKEVGFRPADEFKFDTRSRPNHISIEEFSNAKNRILDACISLDFKFIVYVILHDIIRNQDLEQQSFWAADNVIGGFNKFLEEDAHDEGICIIDNLPHKNQYKYLRDKFITGLSLQKEKTARLERIKLFGTTCINASHACSAMDIVLGSFRYCINNPKNEDAAKTMMGKVAQLLWHKRVGNELLVRDRGLILRPVEVRNLLYEQEYKELIENISHLL